MTAGSSLVNTAQFRPFSYDEMLAPLAAYTNEKAKVEEIYIVTMVDECGREYYRDTVKDYRFVNDRFTYTNGDSSMSLPDNHLILKTIRK